MALSMGNRNNVHSRGNLHGIVQWDFHGIVQGECSWYCSGRFSWHCPRVMLMALSMGIVHGTIQKECSCPWHCPEGMSGKQSEGLKSGERISGEKYFARGLS